MCDAMVLIYIKKSQEDTIFPLHILISLPIPIYFTPNYHCPQSELSRHMLRYSGDELKIHNIL